MSDALLNSCILIIKVCFTTELEGFYGLEEQDLKRSLNMVVFVTVGVTAHNR